MESCIPYVKRTTDKISRILKLLDIETVFTRGITRNLDRSTKDNLKEPEGSMRFLTAVARSTGDWYKHSSNQDQRSQVGQSIT